MKAEYVQHWGDDLIVANSARVSFDKQSEWHEEVFGSEDAAIEYAEKVGGTVNYDHIYSDRWFGGYPVVHLAEKDRKLVNFLAREGHTSTFEHMGATLRLKVPIFIARQIQRHRTFSYNEISRRYVDNEPEFFWPDKWRKRAENVKQGSSDEEIDVLMIHQGIYPDAEVNVRDFVEVGVDLYNKLLEEGVAPEQARMILPQNMYTSFYMSGNLRAWSHFLSLRLDSHAQKEIQDIAQQIESILQPLFPVSMKALREHSDD
mgnify:CR=1 FL=1|nr:MAG TPA_asm: Thymidylate synthase complementing protein [Caudoviricetes sp.]